MSSLSQPWLRWIGKNKNKISDGFEEDFVKRVLANIAAIEPDDLVAQYPFKDSNGKNRRIDFLIRNREKGYFLPIELDGAQKDTNQKRWADFLSRQNDLIDVVGPLLRFSNKQFFQNPSSVQNRIKQVLGKQQEHKHRLEQLEAEQHQQKSELDTLKAQLQEYEKQVSTSNSEAKARTDVGSSASPNHDESRPEELAELKSSIQKLSEEFNRKEERFEDSKRLLLEESRAWAEDVHQKALQELEQSKAEIETVKKESQEMQKGVLLLAAVVIIFALGFVAYTYDGDKGSNQAKRPNPEATISNAQSEEKIIPVQIIKLSRTGICHAPGSTYYEKTKNFQSFNSIGACLNSGGRLPKR